MLLILFLEFNTNVHTFLCKKCDVGFYVITDTYCLQKKIVFIVSVSLLHKILNACQN